MYELSISGTISSAHFLRKYHGKCENLHGHTYKIEIIVQGDKLDNTGMIADFTFLKKELKKLLSELDHSCLNDLPFFKEENPTTENLAKYIYTSYSKIVHPLKVKSTQVWESDSASVLYYEN